MSDRPGKYVILSQIQRSYIQRESIAVTVTGNRALALAILSQRSKLLQGLITISCEYTKRTTAFQNKVGGMIW